MIRTLWTAAAIYVAAVLVFALAGSHVTLPYESLGMSPNAGSLNAALEQTLGKRVTADFLFEYASGKALRRHEDPYERLATLVERAGGPKWEVETANPHPPTMVALALPLTLLSYEHALVAWSLGMIFVLVATLRLGGVRFAYAIPLGIAIACCWPAAYGIGNAVPLIGLGAALAYRYRDRPWLAGIGLALAAAPKLSGVALWIAFLVALRWRPVAWAAVVSAALAVVPVLLYPRAWSRYLDAGADAIRINAERADNASLLNTGSKAGIPTVVTLALLVLLTVIVALRLRDTYWPATWFIVAALPIAWMYSLLTLIPLLVWTIESSRRAAVALSIGAAGLAIASQPLGDWTLRTYPVVVALALLALVTAGRTGLWPDEPEPETSEGRSRDPHSDSLVAATD